MSAIQGTPYTDAEGVVHIWAPFTGLTLCGKSTANHTAAHATMACDACVAESIQSYAREQATEWCIRRRG